VLLTSYHGRCDYIDFVDVASRMVYTLREEHKCDFVIALTHMMGYNDTKLAEKVDGIDLILGGHDHLIRHEIHRTTQIVKSGTNFKNFSILRIEQTAAEANKKKCFNIHHQLEEVTRKFPSDPVLEPYVREMYDKFQQRQDQIICLTDCEIDLRFCFIRKNESPYISMFADWYRFFTEADCVILSSGNFRNDCIVHEGPLSYGTVTNQIEDKVVVKAVKGSQLLQALDNAVAMYPNLSGRFACFSNLEFTWDSKR
jgi:5'-nucleotidase